MRHNRGGRARGAVRVGPDGLARSIPLAYCIFSIVIWSSSRLAPAIAETFASTRACSASLFTGPRNVTTPFTAVTLTFFASTDRVSSAKSACRICAAMAASDEAASLVERSLVEQSRRHSSACAGRIVLLVCPRVLRRRLRRLVRRGRRLAGRGVGRPHGRVLVAGADAEAERNRRERRDYSELHGCISFGFSNASTSDLRGGGAAARRVARREDASSTLCAAFHAVRKPCACSRYAKRRDCGRKAKRVVSLCPLENAFLRRGEMEATTRSATHMAERWESSPEERRDRWLPCKRGPAGRAQTRGSSRRADARTLSFATVRSLARRSRS